ncbi:hypothetical protein SD457_06430 [Coprobacillaceae bacterium CR2/5/TPMF4]|nr:hypothetical protein SD457_06430 [Coprobacillaceae bacterium CR2/5/TPMF4]
MNGRTIATDIKQIKLITTPSSIKYLKFGTLNEWLNKISDTFGVVKYEKKTHYLEGRAVRCHYQLINSLQMTRNDVEQLVKPSLDYLDLIKNDPAVLRYHIRYSCDVENELDEPLIYQNDITYKLLGLNSDFAKTKMYDVLKNEVIDSFIKIFVVVMYLYQEIIQHYVETLLKCYYNQSVNLMVNLKLELEKFIPQDSSITKLY